MGRKAGHNHQRPLLFPSDGWDKEAQPLFSIMMKQVSPYNEFINKLLEED